MMCTITFVPRKNGYALGMNRDEKLTRPTALPPVHSKVNGPDVLFPSEPMGGTWISLNRSGVTLALINWYSVRDRVENGISRGEVVKASMAVQSPPELNRILEQLLLKFVNPLRLVSVFAQTREIVEWQWNLRNLRVLSHPWEANTWISSGYDENGAERVRRKVFCEALKDPSAGSLKWLRRLHSSHLPEPGPYSVCMHRDDAETVSYTEVLVVGKTVRMRYQPGVPCSGSPRYSASA